MRDFPQVWLAFRPFDQPKNRKFSILLLFWGRSGVWPLHVWRQSFHPQGFQYLGTPQKWYSKGLSYWFGEGIGGVWLLGLSGLICIWVFKICRGFPIFKGVLLGGFTDLHNFEVQSAHTFPDLYWWYRIQLWNSYFDLCRLLIYGIISQLFDNCINCKFFCILNI